LLLLASLEERSTYRELDYFLRVWNRDSLERGDLVDEAIEDELALFWEAMTLPVEKALPCFWE